MRNVREKSILTFADDVSYISEARRLRHKFMVPMQETNRVCAITITPEERKRGCYDSPALQKALEALHADDLVVLKVVVDVGHVDSLNKYMCDETDQITRESEAYNHSIRSNILQGPPITNPEYLFQDVYFNPFLIQVMNALLDFPSVFNFLKGDTALRNTPDLRQPIHKDITFDHPQCPFCFIANVPLCDFTSENGSTEFWLGSHIRASGSEQHLSQAESLAGAQDTR